MIALMLTAMLTAPFGSALAVLAQGKPEGLSETDCRKLHDSLKPPVAELWRDIPWKVSLVEAQNLASREKKPLFIWSMDGNPLGCGWNNVIIDRASTFSDPEIIASVKAQCVAVAIDQWYTRRQKDAEGDFYRKIAGQSPQNNFNATTQGLFLATPDGKLLGFTNHRSPEWVKNMLKKGLADYQPAETALLTNPKPDPNFCYQPPQGGLVVVVTSKVLTGYKAAINAEIGFFQNSLGRDVLWVRKDEHQALARGEVMDSLKKRIAKFNLLDNTRGEPYPWQDAEIKQLEMSIKDGVLTGTAHLETARGDRGYKADLRGTVESKDGKVTRLDVVAKGQAWGASGCTLAAKPEGKFTLAATFRLATGTDEAEKVMPQGAKSWLPDYLR